MRKIIPITHANTILSFLQNIEDVEDAREFFRIAIEALEAGAEQTDDYFDRQTVVDLVQEIDKRI